MTRHPRDRWRIVSFVVALAGAGIAGYLTRAHYDQGALVCGLGDCHTVQQSKYLDLLGVPVAALGLGMYLAVLAIGVARWRRPVVDPTASLAAFALALAGALYASYLTYVELFVIDAVCQWCVATALLTVVVLIAEAMGALRWIRSLETDNP